MLELPHHSTPHLLGHVLASQYLLKRRASMPSFKLKRVAKELGIVVEEESLHDAYYDVKLTRQIYRIVTGLQVEI